MTRTAAFHPDLSERFQAVHVAAISDCLDRIGLRYQTLSCELFSLDPATRIAGPAFTVRGRPSDETDPAIRIGPRVLASAEAGSVVCYDAGGDDRAGVWGELWTAGAVSRGVRGAIVDGAVRDVERIRDYQFPLFHRFRRPTDATGRFTVVEHSVEVELAGVAVRPGDYVIVDQDGAVVVPQDRAVEVCELAEDRVRRERKMRESLDQGREAQEVYQLYEHF